MKRDLREMDMNIQTFMTSLTDRKINKYNYKIKNESNEKSYDKRAYHNGEQQKSILH